MQQLVTHPAYSNYPEQPYISTERDLEAWEKTPEQFPYGVVPRANMQRLDEGLLPGHIVLLWRVHFGTFTNESVIPLYFEYRYGVDSVEALETLLTKGYIELCSAKESLYLLSIPVLKRLLKECGLSGAGTKATLVQRVSTEVPPKAQEAAFSLRAYRITPDGSQLLQKYDNIIQKHGPKM